MSQRLGFGSRNKVMEGKSNTGMFEKDSYEKHTNWYNEHFPDRADKIKFYSTQRLEERNIASWLQDCFFSCLVPLLKSGYVHWLTVGDAYGFDAQHLSQKGMTVCASDLSTDFLDVAREIGIIEKYSAQNAEQLTYEDNAFDYILCKESYHHFPRPYAALYEMIRVARSAIVIIEPNDPVIKMPLLLFLFNITRFSAALQRRIWKNRFSFEPVGNFVYKVSEREFEKFAAGLNLPAVAFKYINPNFFHKNTQFKKTVFSEPAFLIVSFKKMIVELLVKLRLISGQVLSTIIFKEVPNEDVLACLKKEGYRIQFIPKSPYL